MGPVQAVSALPVLRDRRDLNPGYLAKGPGVAGICPVPAGGHSDLSRKMEAGVETSTVSPEQPSLDTHLAAASSLGRGLLGQTSSCTRGRI